MYSKSSSTHSSLIGWAFDGYPIYGAYAYTTAMDSSSAIKLIECLELQSYTEKGEPDKDAGYDHMNDALGYITWRLFNPLHMGAGRKTGIRLY